MIVMSKIGQSMAAGFGAALLTVIAVGAAVGPVRAEAMPRSMAAAPAGLVAAQLSSQAAA
ncbi:MAG: hypothetical protein JWO81_545 [Alphaproteobacteria bacterium]|nr:hypothetical protein [Alphaproteobacteria bacterium]